MPDLREAGIDVHMHGLLHTLNHRLIGEVYADVNERVRATGEFKNVLEYSTGDCAGPEPPDLTLLGPLFPECRFLSA
jgi:hypothetical protein